MREFVSEKGKFEYRIGRPGKARKSMCTNGVDRKEKLRKKGKETEYTGRLCKVIPAARPRGHG